jgi:hypothetical protein
VSHFSTAAYTARRSLGIHPREYLLSVLPKLG